MKIQDVKKQLAASLYLKPATRDELLTRFVCSEYVLDRLLTMMERDGWISERQDDVWHVIKASVKPHLKEYDLYGMG